jgi:hypothetical protein
MLLTRFCRASGLCFGVISPRCLSAWCLIAFGMTLCRRSPYFVEIFGFISQRYKNFANFTATVPFNSFLTHRLSDPERG